jgi:hypothetical protein
MLIMLLHKFNLMLKLSHLFQCNFFIFLSFLGILRECLHLILYLGEPLFLLLDGSLHLLLQLFVSELMLFDLLLLGLYSHLVQLNLIFISFLVSS